MSQTLLSKSMCVLRFPAVQIKIGGYSRMHVDRLEKAGKFPKRVKLGENSVGWFEHEIDAWLKAKASARGVEVGT